MGNHDRYEVDILKALQRIATSLDKIEKKMPDKIQTTNELREYDNCKDCVFFELDSCAEPCCYCFNTTGDESKPTYFERRKSR